MRTKLIAAALVALALLGGCHRKGGGYLAPTPQNAPSNR